MRLHPDTPIAGILAPLFALRSDGDLGIGDTRTLRDFACWAVENGFRLVQLLPINETGGDNSPYMAISSIAIEPATLCLDPDSLPDLTREDYETILKEFNLPEIRSGSVRYREVKALKEKLLRSAFARFGEIHLKRNTSRAREFRAFARHHQSWLAPYGLFRALMQTHGSEQWDRWPEEVSTAEKAQTWLESLSSAERREWTSRIRFFEYVQWIAFTQWREVFQFCEAKGVSLMGDVPFGVSYYSADVFADPQLFDLEWSGGAPPEKVFQSDPFTEKWGQNWGVPLYRWDRMREDGFAWWKRRVNAVREMFHLFRIDHILGFYRIYSFPWRPERNLEFLPLTDEEAKTKAGGRLPGFKPNDDSCENHCEANRIQGEEILKALVLEAGEYRLIGEDLGTVPHYVRPSLTSMGIAGFKIPQWERTWETRLIPGREYPRLSLSTYATHDHPPLKAHWDGLVERFTRNQDDGARWELQCLADYAGIQLPLSTPYDDVVCERLLAALFEGNSWLTICMISDLFGSEQRFNVPGAIAESNWSARMDQAISEWRTDPVCISRMVRVRNLLLQTGRTP